MTPEIYRYEFKSHVEMEEVKASLLLSVIASEGMLGRAQITLDSAFRLDEEKRMCVLDGSTPSGRAIALVFTALLQREFGEDSFRVERIEPGPNAGDPDVTAAASKNGNPGPLTAS